MNPHLFITAFTFFILIKTFWSEKPPYILFSLSALLTLFGFLSKYGWCFDIASHFRVQYLVIQLLSGIFCVFLKRWKLFALALLCAVINFSIILPLYLPGADLENTTVQKTRNIKLLLMNVNSQNKDYKKTIEYIESIQPDILALEEINTAWIEALSGVLSKYPYYQHIPRSDNFGIGLYSKLPPEKINVKHYSSVTVPSIVANFNMAGIPFTLLLTHPVPPSSNRYYQWRNEQLKNIVKERGEFEENLIVLGDLNSTSWSYYFQDFLQGLNLRDSRKGFGLQNTWPSHLFILSIAIDHCLISNRFSVLERKIGPDIGSDHYPLYVELRLAGS